VYIRQSRSCAPCIRAVVGGGVAADGERRLSSRPWGCRTLSRVPPPAQHQAARSRSAVQLYSPGECKSSPAWMMTLNLIIASFLEYTFTVHLSNNRSSALNWKHTQHTLIFLAHLAANISSVEAPITHGPIPIAGRSVAAVCKHSAAVRCPASARAGCAMCDSCNKCPPSRTRLWCAWDPRHYTVNSALLHPLGSFPSLFVAHRCSFIFHDKVLSCGWLWYWCSNLYQSAFVNERDEDENVWYPWLHLSWLSYFCSPPFKLSFPPGFCPSVTKYRSACDHRRRWMGTLAAAVNCTALFLSRQDQIFSILNRLTILGLHSQVQLPSCR